MTSLATPPLAAATSLLTLEKKLRLLIYAFVFAGCHATVWLDGEFGVYWKNLPARRRAIRFRKGRCCYEHFGEGFGFLTSCKLVYNEGLATYWKETILKVSRNVLSPNIFPKIASCELKMVCAYLPPEIKTNLRHLRNAKLPVTHGTRPTQGDPDWIPTLLSQFLNLKSCAFFAGPLLAGGLKVDSEYLLRVPDSLNMCWYYGGVGPFHIRGGMSPAALIEIKTGVSQDFGVMILSMGTGEKPVVKPPLYKLRVSPISMHVVHVE